MPDIEAKLRFLKTPGSYGEAVHQLECIETHMSWVFLAGERVYKLKKAVSFPFLDFMTLAAREYYCREEVRLNARLAPGVYLGLAALQWHAGGFTLVDEARLPAPGETVDWLVVMRRLPQDQMLHRRIASHQATREDIDALVDVLGVFYRSVPAAPLDAQQYAARFQSEQALNRAILLQPQFQLCDAAPTLDHLDAVLAHGTPLLAERVARHRVLDGHGDLRPDHVCMLHPPVVIDCLEFNPLLRQSDPFDELAYLGLECDLAGASWIGPRMVSGLSTALDDHPPAALLFLYKAHRAALRARLAIAHLLDVCPRSPDKWRPLCERYLACARLASREFIASMPHGKFELPAQTAAQQRQ